MYESYMYDERQCYRGSSYALRIAKLDHLLLQTMFETLEGRRYFEGIFWNIIIYYCPNLPSLLIIVIITITPKDDHGNVDLMYAHVVSYLRMQHVGFSEKQEWSKILDSLKTNVRSTQYINIYISLYIYMGNIDG